jgi:hypothetical protein
MHVCLLYPDEVEELVDVSSATPENVTVRYLPRKSLRVFKDRQERFIVPQNRLDEWSVPGS